MLLEEKAGIVENDCSESMGDWMVDVVTKLLSKLLTIRLVEYGDSLDNTGGCVLGDNGDCENVFVVADDVVTVEIVEEEEVSGSACCSGCWSSVVVVPSGWLCSCSELGSSNWIW